VGTAKIGIRPLNTQEKTDAANATALTTQLFHLLHRAGQGGDELFLSLFREADLTPRQYTVLTAAQARQGPSQAALVADTGIDRSTLADIIGRLVTKGLVERHRTQRDARAYAIAVTDKGHDIIANLAPRVATMEHEVLAAVPEDARDTFIRHLEAIVATLSEN